ncbi:hypothetical protein EG349_19185 [Chryseobacterium shandongense]|uniref:Uncharacterized protein n=1 Tax=Chryseobacterium shandongense TaxID=1493872 RepID=A0AAD1DNX1_9FLAO|nr:MULTISPECIES: hypothetical protein [Chryseobacterium]AZA88745.1 hypothetical protein EG349_19185 [Chryseobacterium shandongense]AZA97287.1 hypothetical protein EG353_17900 [Chryseobacterium shandongense]
MFNIISYLIFLAAASYITIDVGRRCYHAGKFYLEYLIHDKNLCLTINRILLGCYYLINLGYIAISLTSWDRIISFEQVVSVTAIRIGNIMLILCVLHYINIITLYLFRKNLTIK